MAAVSPLAKLTGYPRVLEKNQEHLKRPPSVNLPVCPTVPLLILDITKVGCTYYAFVSARCRRPMFLAFGTTLSQYLVLGVFRARYHEMSRFISYSGGAPDFAALTKKATKRVCMVENPSYRIWGAPDFCLPPSTGL